MAPIRLQDLRQRLYDKAKAEKQWRFWGLYGHVGKLETLKAAYDSAKRKDGAPGIDGVTFAAIEAAGLEGGAYGYRPGRKAQDAVERVREAIIGGKTQVIDLDLAAYLEMAT
jgi:hypothetical protein